MQSAISCSCLGPQWTFSSWWKRISEWPLLLGTFLNMNGYADPYHFWSKAAVTLTDIFKCPSLTLRFKTNFPLPFFLPSPFLSLLGEETDTYTHFCKNKIQLSNTNQRAYLFKLTWNPLPKAAEEPAHRVRERNPTCIQSFPLTQLLLFPELQHVSPAQRWRPCCGPNASPFWPYLNHMVGGWSVRLAKPLRTRGGRDPPGHSHFLHENSTKNPAHCGHLSHHQPG